MNPELTVMPRGAERLHMPSLHSHIHQVTGSVEDYVKYLHARPLFSNSCLFIDHLSVQCPAIFPRDAAPVNEPCLELGRKSSLVLTAAGLG